MKPDRTAARVLSLALLLLAGAACARPADFELTPGEAGQVARGDIVVRTQLDASQRGGTVLAALRIDAPPAMVFQALTRCADALKYVPNLKRCQSRDEQGVRLVAHELDFGWYAPRLKYVFRVEAIENERIVFRQVSGDFRANEGTWEFEADVTGRQTLLRHRARIDPPGYVPGWLARRTIKQEIPRMLSDLRQYCEQLSLSTLSID